MPEHYTYPLPAPRIAHAIQGTIRLARDIMDAADHHDAESVKRLADKIILAVFEVPSDAAALQLTLDRYQEDMRAMRDEGLAMAQELNELRGTVMRHAEDASAAPLPIPLTKEPRAKAAGA